ncbi:baseplate assembly protein [Martelella alba]|uniref:Baseplate assembly protein n=2 Tax=Martelella alba TaxID=2590451 RepID=A0ABY2SER9_9HYPH|nr:baseplate assembly protein [Martelella alba]
MMLGIGKVTGLSDSGVIQRVQYATAMEVRGDTPRMAEFGFSSGLPAGTDVVLGFLGGDRSSAVVIASNHQSYRHAGLNAGETVIYNQWGMYVKLTKDGIIVEANGQPVTVNNATTLKATATESVTLDTPRLYVTGDIIDNSGSNAVTLKQLRDAYNEHTHQVAEVESGSSTVTSKTTGNPVE